MSGYWIAGIVAWVAMWIIGYVMDRSHHRKRNTWTCGERIGDITVGLAFAPVFVIAMIAMRLQGMDWDKPARW